MFSVELRGDYIAGAFRPDGTGHGFVVDKDPGDLSTPLGQIRLDPAHVNYAVDAANFAFRSWAEHPVQERLALLERYKEELWRNADRFATLIVREVGKTRREAWGEVRSMLFKVDVVLKEAMSLLQDIRPDGVRGFCRFRPRGVHVILAPPVFAAHVSSSQLVVALAAGNTVVLRPSSLTPAIGQTIAELVAAAGFPAGVFNVVNTDAGGAESLVLHPDVAVAMITGSQERIRRLLRASLDYPNKLIVVEAAGQNAAIVMADANMDRALHEVYVGAFLTSGQRYMTTRRLILEDKVADAFCESFLSMVRHTPVGYGLDDDVFMGPLVSEEAVEALEKARQSDERKERIEWLVKGDVPFTRHDGYYVAPSVHLVRRFDPVYDRKEPPLLAPDLAVHIVGSLDEAIRIANSTDYPLAMSVFSQSESVFDEVWRASAFGVVNWNRATVSVTARMPIAGRGLSGNDHPGGLFAPYYCTVPVSSLTEEGYLPPGERFPNVPRWKTPMIERMK